ncbi:MAG: hypothetical protein AAF967_10870, partial [Pseudomonadota bacterium]
ALDHEACTLLAPAACALLQTLGSHFDEAFVTRGYALVDLAGALVQSSAFWLRFVDAGSGPFDKSLVARGRALDHEACTLPASAACALFQTLGSHFDEALVARGYALMDFAGALVEASAFWLWLVDAGAGLLDKPLVARGCSFDHQAGALPTRTAIAFPQAPSPQLDEATIARGNPLMNLAGALVQCTTFGLWLWLGFRFGLRLRANAFPQLEVLDEPSVAGRDPFEHLAWTLIVATAFAGLSRTGGDNRQR